MKYKTLIQKIKSLQKEGLELFSVGKSVLGKDIWATHIGSFDGTQILIQGGIHAREYITTLLMIEQAKYLAKINPIKNGGIYFLFMTNPDGIEIVLDGIDNLPSQITKDYLTLANKSSDFSQYKANVNLVDLNTNFDADWGTGSQNLFQPSPAHFIGFYPNSEREVVNLINFTLKIQPNLTISYHSKGEVIYYGFSGQTPAERNRDKEIGLTLSNSTGYKLLLTKNSSGGYKDWCIQKLKIPAYTIEIGSDNLKHPIGTKHLPQIFDQNKDIPLLALEQAIKFQKEISE